MAHVLIGPAKESLADYLRPKAGELALFEGRDVLECSLETAAEESRAAHCLWQKGQSAAAYRLAVTALERLLSVLDACPAELRSRGAPAPGDLLDDIERLPVPASHHGFTAAHAWLFERIWDEHQRLHRVLKEALRTPQQVRRLRAMRWGIALLAVALVSTAASWSRLHGVRAMASAQYSEDLGPERVLDGAAATEWLLPDHSTGWIDLAFRTSRDVHAVRLKDAHNRYFNDRATRRFKVELFAGDELLASAKGEFPEFDPEGPWKDVLVSASGVTRVRVTVVSYFRRGGGFAEIEVDRIRFADDGGSTRAGERAQLAPIEPTTGKIQLMNDIGEVPPVDLLTTLAKPIGKTLLIHFLAPVELLLDRVQDMMQEVPFLARILAVLPVNHPVRASRCQNRRPGVTQVQEKVPASLAVSRGHSIADALIHTPMVDFQ